MKNDIIQKAVLGDIKKISDFLIENSYNEFDSLEFDKKLFYKSKADSFLKNKEKSVYFMNDNDGKISGIILYESLPFDTKLFNAKTVKIDDIVIKKKLDRIDIKNVSGKILDFFIAKMKGSKTKFIQCKMDSRNIYISKALEKYSFKLVSQDVTFLRKISASKQIAHKYQVCFCDKDDVESLYKISKESYKTTRFHNDTNITIDKADEMQGLWIKNCFHQKLADEIIILKDKDELCGYVACSVLKNINLTHKKNIGRIILIAVDKEFRGKGVGSVLIQESLKWFKNNNCDYVAVGTQIINIPAIRLYQKNGFELKASYLAFHKWI